jgi:hypothetical protein
MECYVCHSDGEWTRKESAFELVMVVGVRQTGLSVSRIANLLFFSIQQFPVCIKYPPTKGHQPT